MSRIALCTIFSFAALTGQAADLSRSQVEFFENKVRPLLANHCYKCHSQSAEKVKGGLLLDTRDGVFAGGNNGPAIVPGNPDKSLLIEAVRYTNPDLQMPPKGEKLTDAQVADLVSWVKMGAPDPRTATIAQKNWVDPNKKHWAFQPVSKPSVPEIKNSSWAKTPMDKFILAKLDEKGLKPNPPADKRTLIRRAAFDLIGLPPTPDEVRAFVIDESAEAFEKVVQRLLDSPHYGERWGRHWLDTARYSDTKGEIRRNREDPNYPFAWTYRDYVIRSFNEDKPYNIFVIEQLAADKLPATLGNPTNLAALGFLTVSDRFMNMQHDIINDRIDVVTKGFLGLTVSCARCHDHKFDPIPTKDYYSLHGIFASCREPEVEPVISKIQNTPDYQDYFKQRTALMLEKRELEEKFQELRRKRDRQGVQQLQRQVRANSTKVAELDMRHPGAPVRAMALEDSPNPRNSPVFIRGEVGNRGQIVPRRFLEVLSGPKRIDFTNGSGRLQLAHAVVDKNNPLTARVMVNRIWLHHFGEGIVTTPDDFGTQAEPPSHPELLDYLAAEFMNNGWSIKKVHKQIMLSNVYQQSSANNPRYAQIDPFNRLLWRANIRRLEFEPLRDSLLAIGGTLDRTQFGRPVNLGREPYSTRRTIYGFIDRNNVAEVLFNFDFANPDMTTGKRHQTTVPQQALFFMNSPLVVEQAKKVVARKDFQALSDTRSRILLLYDLIYQRLPRPDEVKLGLEFIAQEPSQERVIPVSNDNRPARRPIGEQLRAQMQQRRGGENPFRVREPLTAWEEYAHALLQANEASFVN